MDISILNKIPVLVIIRHHSPFNVKRLFSSILESGSPCAEITLNTPNACKLIKEGVEQFNNDMCIGAGTVLTVSDAQRALNAGAQFIVSPVFNANLVAFCVKEGIPVFPGAATPTEVYNASIAGAHMVKIFPASMVGSQNLKAMKAPLDNIKLLAVGGINEANVCDYLNNGANAIAVGSGTVKPQWIENGEFAKVQESLKSLNKSVLHKTAND